MSPAESLINRYFEGVMLLAADDASVYDDLVAAVHMTKPTEALLHPRIALKVLGRGVVGAARRAFGMEGASASSGASAR